MSAHLTDLEVGRRLFLKGAGGIAVAFVLAPALPAAPAAAAKARLTVTPLMTRTAPSIDYAPGVAWVVLTPGRVTVHTGRVELGTGVETALAQIAVEELRLGMQRVDVVQGDTQLTPDEGYTAGSKSLQNGGPPLRRAAATAYQALLGLAAAHLKVDRASLVAADGVFSVPGTRKAVTYERLLAQADVVKVADTAPPLRPVADYQVVGTSVARRDLPDKVHATFTYIADVDVPGLLHGRVVKPSGRNARNPVVGNLARAQAIPGFVGVVQQGDFVGVVATTEWAAVQAINPQAGITVTWTPGPALVPQASLPTALRDPANHFRVFTPTAPAKGSHPAAQVEQALASATVTRTASYFTPYQMHASMGASAAVAHVRSAPDPVTGIQAEVWSSTQGVYPLRRAVAAVLGVAEPAVHVRYVEGSGCYGHNGADDVAADAALLSKLAGAPVKLQWTRQQEHGWEPVGPAMAHDLRGGVADGRVVAWEHVLSSPTHGSRANANRGSVLAGLHTGSLPPPVSGNPTNNVARNAPTTYAIPTDRLVVNMVKSFEGTAAGTNWAPAAPLRYRFLRSTALRSLGGFSNSFANESFLDELCHAGGLDPLQTRVDALAGQPRAQAVVEALRPAWAGRPTGGGRGAGLAFQQYEVENAYAAAYVEVTVDPGTGRITVDRVVVSHDCGIIINPDGLRNQIEGNVIQGVSRTLKEELHYSGDRVTSVVWDAVLPFNRPPQYDVLRFDEVPRIECILIDMPDEPAWGAGEPAIGCLGGAIGNAVFAATGKRLRSLPMRPADVLAAPVTG